MTEQAPSGLPVDQVRDPGAEPESDLDPAETDGEASATGVPAVDRVLADVDRVDDLPLDEHQAAFERAHSALRSALDAEPDAPA